MRLALWASGIWLRYAALQNLPSGNTESYCVWEFTRLDPVTLANDDPLLRVRHVHPIVLDRRNVRASPGKLLETLSQSDQLNGSTMGLIKNLTKKRI